MKEAAAAAMAKRKTISVATDGKLNWNYCTSFMGLNKLMCVFIIKSL